MNLVGAQLSSGGFSLSVGVRGRGGKDLDHRRDAGAAPEAPERPEV